MPNWVRDRNEAEWVQWLMSQGSGEHRTTVQECSIGVYLESEAGESKFRRGYLAGIIAGIYAERNKAALCTPERFRDKP